MIVISLLTSVVFAQSCISLKDSKNCKNLDHYAILPSTEFSDVAGLDKFLDEGKFTNSNFMSAFKSMFDCPNFDGRGGRYGMSSYCAFLISASQSQCEKQYEPNTAPLVLCSSTCQAHMESIKGVFSNTTQCNANPSSSANDQRKTTIQPSQSPPNIAQYCADLQNNAAAQNSTPCFIAVAEESQNCGFLFAEETTLHCEKNPTDPCCAAAKAASSGTSVLNPVNNTFVIAGIVAAVLIFIGIVYIVFQRMSKSSQRPTTAYEPDRQSKFQSMFKSSEPAPPLPTTMNMGPDSNRRSSLFTTIRASQVLRPGDAPPIPNLPSQFDESQYTNNEGFKVQVFEDYDAGMEDEISCNVGDIIIVEEEYDDGWATGLNITSGETGIFPMAICEDLGASATSSRVGRPRSALSARTQSLLPQSRY